MKELYLKLKSKDKYIGTITEFSGKDINIVLYDYDTAWFYGNQYIKIFSAYIENNKVTVLYMGQQFLVSIDQLLIKF